MTIMILRNTHLANFFQKFGELLRNPKSENIDQFDEQMQAPTQSQKPKMTLLQTDLSLLLAPRKRMLVVSEINKVNS